MIINVMADQIYLHESSVKVKDTRDEFEWVCLKWTHKGIWRCQLHMPFLPHKNSICKKVVTDYIRDVL